jgi:hypothetical protein
MVSHRLPRIRCGGNLFARLMTTGLLPPYPIYPPLAREASTPDAWLRPPPREGTRPVPLITMLGRWLTGRRPLPSTDMRGGAVAAISIECNDALPILARTSQGTSRTRAGQHG